MNFNSHFFSFYFFYSNFDTFSLLTDTKFRKTSELEDDYKEAIFKCTLYKIFEHLANVLW